MAGLRWPLLAKSQSYRTKAPISRLCESTYGSSDHPSASWEAKGDIAEPSYEGSLAEVKHGFTWVDIFNLQPESVAGRLLVKHSQPAFTRTTTSKQDKFLQVFVLAEVKRCLPVPLGP
eukprot:1158369-Pelagomonas_calceolata.AAC.3